VQLILLLQVASKQTLNREQSLAVLSCGQGRSQPKQLDVAQVGPSKGSWESKAEQNKKSTFGKVKAGIYIEAEARSRSMLLLQCRYRLKVWRHSSGRHIFPLPGYDLVYEIVLQFSLDL
jgi:hypothetical protein